MSKSLGGLVEIYLSPYWEIFKAFACLIRLGGVGKLHRGKVIFGQCNSNVNGKSHELWDLAKVL